MKEIPSYIPKLSKNKNGDFVLGDTVLRTVEDCSISFQNGKAEGLARIDITMMVNASLTDLDAGGQGSTQGQ